MHQMESQVSTSEALAITRRWNPTWNSKFFMVVYLTIEIAAIEEQFPGNVAYICDFHRIQALQWWARSKKNNLSSAKQEMFLEFMKGIGNASYEDQIKEQVEALRKSNLYRDHETLKNYVENTWLSCAYRWVQAFHKQQANNIVNTKNKIEA